MSHNNSLRSFQLPCPGGVCSSRELPSCTESLEWEEEEVGFEKCQELSFKGASVLCGINGTKEITKRLHFGAGIVEEVVTTPCNDCGDLSAALEWTAWTPCADETSGRAVEGMLCRLRGNSHLGFEKEEQGRASTNKTAKFTFLFLQNQHVLFSTILRLVMFLAGDLLVVFIRSTTLPPVLNTVTSPMGAVALSTAPQKEDVTSTENANPPQRFTRTTPTV